MSFEHLKFGDTTGKIIKSGYAVHDYFGWGFPEIVYKRSLIIEMGFHKLHCLQEVEKPIFYKNNLIYKRKVDLLVEDKILVEVKALKELDSGDINQILNYMNIYNFEVGLLLNFGQTEFYFKRFVLNTSTKKSVGNFKNP